MPINIPSVQDSLNKINSSIFAKTQGRLSPTSDPVVSSIALSQAEFQNALYSDMQDSVNQTFSRSATEESFLSAIAFDSTNNRIRRKIAEFAQGDVLVVSEEAIDIPSGSQFVTEDGNVYESIVLRTTSSQSFIIESLERIEGIAYATIPDHNLGNLMDITFSGAMPVEFNGINEITIIDKDTISYVNSGINESAAGTIHGSFFGNRVTVKSLLPGESTNKDFNTAIEIASSIGATASYITFNGITVGRDIESLASFKNRIVQYLQYPQNPGNIYQHVSWVEQNTDASYCYFFNSEDALYLYLTSVVSKINEDYSFTAFSSDELLAIKARFIDNNQFALTGVSALQLSFTNFSPVNINITISGLSPNSIAMKTAINAKLKEYIALLPIKFYLKSGQLSSSKIASIVTMARDPSGNTPSIDSVSVSGYSSLDANIKKPILGTVNYA